MYRLVYPVLFGVSYLGTRFLGVERTIQGFSRVGKVWKKLRLAREKSPDRLERELSASYGVLPLSVRCLDQAVVTWHLLNLHDHPAQLKIGVTLSPFQGHAWVELGARTFVDFVYVPDMQVVAEYPSWTSTL